MAAKQEMASKKALKLMIMPLAYLTLSLINFSCAYSDNEKLQKMIWHQGRLVKLEVTSRNQLALDNLPRTPPYKPQILDMDAYTSNADIVIAVLLKESKKKKLHIFRNHVQNSLVLADISFYDPWKLQLADVDKDGDPELALGVFKTSPFHPVLAKRLFLFSVFPRFKPKWLGSRLSRPLINFSFAETEADCLLIALEKTRSQSQEHRTYRWDGFGFTAVPNILADVNQPLMESN